MHKLIVTVLMALAMGAVSSPALAAKPVNKKSVSRSSGVGLDHGLTIWAVLDGGADAFGLGGRYMLPLMKDGFLEPSSLPDELVLEFGLDYSYWSESSFFGSWSFHTFRPTAGVAWLLKVADKISIYPKLDAGVAFYRYGSDFNTAWGTRNDANFFIDVAAGFRYEFTPALLLRLETGAYDGWWGLRAGVQMDF